MIKIKDIVKDTKDLKLLYVEDNQDIRESTLLILENLFDNITIAVDGIDGLDKFKQNQDFDIVITDINMPKMNGLEMSKEILNINSEIPIYIFSAHDETRYFMDAIKLGVDGYLLKPLDLDQFVQVLNKYLQRVELKKSKIELEKLKIEKEKTQLVFNMIRNISHHWKQPLTVIATIAGGCTFKQDAGLEFTEEDFKSAEIISTQVANLAKVLEKFEGLNLEKTTLKEIEDMISIGYPIYKYE